MSTKLTHKDIARVREVWANVMKKAENNGATILTTLIEKHNYYSKFDRFKTNPRERIKEHPMFRNHCVKLMKKLDEVVQNLDNPQVLVPILASIGKSHKARNIVRQDFENLKIVLLDFLQEKFEVGGKDLNAWTQALSIAVNIIGKSLEK